MYIFKKKLEYFQIDYNLRIKNKMIKILKVDTGEYLYNLEKKKFYTT